jgi:5-methylcytosine-specific restriction endonuclease McrA
LYIIMTYNVYHEKITDSYNCSIDGGGKNAAPAAIRGNGNIANRCFRTCDSANGKNDGEGEMNITYYPNGKSNEGFEVGHIVNNMRVRWYKRNGRLMTTLRPAGATCAHCGGAGGWRKGQALQAHHIKPIWAWMLDQVLRSPPNDSRQGEDMALRAQWGLMELDAHFHTPEKLVHLCKRCHEKEEVKALKKWKAHYNKHPKIAIR